MSSQEVTTLLRSLRDVRAIPPSRVFDYQDAMKWLENARIPPQVPASLIRGLKADLRVLQSPAASAGAKEAAVDDLLLKARFCRASPEGLGAAIEVTVRTLVAQAESRGWEVVYKTAVEMEDQTLPPAPFAALSSPTGERFTAGRFVVWARDPKDARREGPKRELIVTGQQNPVRFDLLTPDAR